MMFKMTEVKYEPDPRLERALDVLWILHADHEQNCSTSAVRSVGSSQVDPYSALAAGVAALFGPLHGGANEQVLRMLDRIGTVDNVPDFLEGVKNRKEQLMGFGHRVYKNYDPRARIIKEHVDQVFEVTGKNPKLDIAAELEKRALDDDFFAERKLYPNVDFYSGLIYEALNLPTEMFTVMFAIPRTAGWMAQWLEMVQDEETKIARPRQIYTGERERDYPAIDGREGARGPAGGREGRAGAGVALPPLAGCGSAPPLRSRKTGTSRFSCSASMLGPPPRGAPRCPSRAAWWPAARPPGRARPSCSWRSRSARPLLAGLDRDRVDGRGRERVDVRPARLEGDARAARRHVERVGHAHDAGLDRDRVAAAAVADHGVQRLGDHDRQLGLVVDPLEQQGIRSEARKRLYSSWSVRWIDMPVSWNRQAGGDHHLGVARAHAVAR